MDDLISRSALMKKIAHHGVFDSIRHVDFDRAAVFEWVKNDMFRYVQDAPAVDAVPVVHAKWIYGKTRSHEWRKCSKCLMSQEIFGSFPYCPNCGARMDAEEDK